MAKTVVKNHAKHHVATHAKVRLHTHVHTAVKALAVACGAAAIAAAAALVTVPQVPTYLSVSVASVPASSRQLYGTPSVPFLGLQMQTRTYPVALKSLMFTFITDSDGSFSNGVANNLDPASAVKDCVLLNNNDVKVSAYVPVIAGQRTITFNPTYSLPADTSGGVVVVCDLSASSPAGTVPDALALTVASINDIAISSVTGDLPPQAVSMPSILNANGANVTILRERPTSAAVVGTITPPSVLTVTAIPASPSIFIVPGATQIMAARFRYDAPSPTVINSMHFTSCQGSGCAATLIARARLLYVDATGKTVVTPAVATSNGGWNFDGLSIPVAPSATVSLLIDATGFSAANVGSSISFTLAADSSLGLGTTNSNENVIFAKSLPVLSLSSDSPSGSASRGMNEVLAFGIKANVDGPVDISELAFHVVATDNGGTNWLSCHNLATSTKWGLRDAASPNARLEDPGDWAFYKADGTPCDNSNSILAYAVVDFPRAGDPQAKSISANQTATWLLRVDTTGASQGDSFQIILPAQSETDAIKVPGFAWSDTWTTNLFNGTGIPGLPLTGGTLSF